MADGAGKLVGIDLGTTFSAIATLDDHGQPVTLSNRDGEMLTPSAVLLLDGQAVVGQAAMDVALEQPGQVATLIKRHMGEPSYGCRSSGSRRWPSRGTCAWAARTGTTASSTTSPGSSCARTAATRARTRSRWPTCGPPPSGPSAP